MMRVANQQWDTTEYSCRQDKRCAALEHLTKMLPKLRQPPKWIALENVKGWVWLWIWLSVVDVTVICDLEELGVSQAISVPQNGWFRPNLVMDL